MKLVSHVLRENSNKKLYKKQKITRKIATDINNKNMNK